MNLNKADKQALLHIVEGGALEEILAAIQLTYFIEWTDTDELAARELLHAKAGVLKDIKKQFRRVQNAD